MLSRFCNLCSRSVDRSITIFPKHYSKVASNVRRKRKPLDKEEDEKSTKGRIPIISCRNHKFNFYQGDNYRKHAPILLASKGWNHRNARGDYFTVHPTKEESKTIQNDSYNRFEDFNLHPKICEVLDKLGIKEPLEIQKMAIPKIMEGCNAVLAAETGCGKTLAYLLPMINQIVHWKKIQERSPNSPLALIVTPTRELAVQIGLEVIKLSKDLNIATKIVTGGKTKRLMRDPPVQYIDILVASFGVISKLSSTGIYKLNFVKYLVLDEADALFHETFEDKVNVFMRRIEIGFLQDKDPNKLPRSTQLVLASATMPSRLSQILQDVVSLDSLEYLVTEKLHRVSIAQKFIRVGPSQKPEELLKYVKPKAANKQSIIVFSNENSTSYWIMLFLNECGIKCVNLNGTMPLPVRQGKYAQFLKGEAHVLSATNAGSRGLDTVMVRHVLNYDFPLSTADYIHRCGRTGRVGSVGESRVTNFIAKPFEIALAQKIERATRKNKPLPIIDMTRSPEMEEDNAGELIMPEEEYEEKMIEDLDSAENFVY